MTMKLWGTVVLGLIFGAGAVAADDGKTAHDFSFTSIEGEALPLSKFEGKAILVVNTASFCGFTKQYAGLQKLWETHQDKGLVVLGVPSNDFGKQEPGTSEEIKSFCQANFDVDFPMTEKVQVTGDKAHPFYRWAASQVSFAGRPRWNFHKYLVDPEGRLVDWFATTTAPDSGSLLKAVAAHLPKPTS